MKHLTDRQIQAYLDGQIIHHHARIRAHLQNCARCRSELSAYQKVYHASGVNPGVTLQSDFALQVLSRLQTQAEKRAQYLETAFVVFIGLLGLGIVFYFVNLSVFWEMARSAASAIHWFEQGLVWIYGNHALQIVNLESIIIVLVALGVIRFIDRLYSQSKLRGV